MDENTYKCAQCGGVFEKVQDENWSDEKAVEEFKRNFPEETEAPAVICEDCYNVIMNQ